MLQATPAPAPLSCRKLLLALHLRSTDGSSHAWARRLDFAMILFFREFASRGVDAVSLRPRADIVDSFG